jgi:hypothetical protein
MSYLGFVAVVLRLLRESRSVVRFVEEITVA